MAKTIKPGDMSNPKLRIGIKKGGMGLRFIHVGEGNLDAIKGQQGTMTSCAKSSKGLKGMAFKSAMKACLKR
jgi:hypothetical protein